MCMCVVGVGGVGGSCMVGGCVCVCVCVLEGEREADIMLYLHMIFRHLSVCSHSYNRKQMIHYS